MKVLVIGAGATLAEARHLGNPYDICPPLIRDFARKTWANYTPHPLLEAYLATLGYHELPRDPRELFFQLEEEGVTNIERFMEFAWENRDEPFEVSGQPVPGYISGLQVNGPGASESRAEGPSFWENLLYHGMGNPLSFAMLRCFHANGSGWRDLELSRCMIERLNSEDVVLNLNYDTLFELALEQEGRPFAYSPHQTGGESLLVVKPHGSLNLVSNDDGFAFGRPGWLGAPQPRGYRSYSGLIPPRLKKSYRQHPISQMILKPAESLEPEKIIMWGIGITESDEDLLALYRRWSKHVTLLRLLIPMPWYPIKWPTFSIATLLLIQQSRVG
ncbi:hypothetical protein A7A08_00791 [Methyloligella halotolerans]|uniref:SIR2-like domain-containing protein n=1 Tax=Methyloligella halotolerans TaxID=1177755 RepID=A0A1E2S373_9HYPH|nr:hypothetical protein [Methyloligella halotolerans]ODA68957.1 hypothetical protein A7A08_00791 [Methyloligella halotolerans]